MQNIRSNASFLYRLMQKWQLQSISQVLLVLLTFTCAGSTVVWLRGLLFESLGFGEETELGIKILAYLVFVFPAYQVLILAYGFVLGQFDFFWRKEKQLFRRLFFWTKRI